MYIERFDPGMGLSKLKCCSRGVKTSHQYKTEQGDQGGDEKGNISACFLALECQHDESACQRQEDQGAEEREALVYQKLIHLGYSLILRITSR